MFHTIATAPAVRPIAPGETSPGSLGGWAVSCPACGFVATTSLSRPFAVREGVDHVAHMIRAEARRRGR